MTIAAFIDQYKIRLCSDEVHLVIPCVARTEEDKRYIHSFCRENRRAMVAYLLKWKQKKDFRAALEASVRRKVFDLMKAWAQYEYERDNQADSRAAEPVPPETDVNAAIASLNAQEFAFYQAFVYARSTDLDKAHCGECAMEEIAAADHGFDAIITRMEQAFENERYHREESGERRQRYGRYLNLMNEMHPAPVYRSDYDGYNQDTGVMMEMIG